jgi:sugar/nucleoside kinase (ribokinase family)
MTIKVVAAGHLCIDLLPDMRTVPPTALEHPGRLYEVGPMATATGGSVSNTGLALDRLGVDVRLLSQVGDDRLGGLILDIIGRINPRLTETITVMPGCSSSYTIALSPLGRDRVFLHYPGTNNLFNADSVDPARIADCDLFHLGYPPILPALLPNDGADLRLIYQRVKALGIVTSLDTAHPDAEGESGKVNWRAVLTNTLPFVDIFLPSIDEIVFMLRRADYDRWHGNALPHLTRAYLRRLADELLAMGAAVAGVKLGEGGLYVRVTDDMARLSALARLPIDLAAWRGGEVWLPAFEAEVVGTTGAGDCCYAGFIAALGHGLGLEDAVRMANAVGGCNVEAADALSGVRTWDATRARVDAGWGVKAWVLPDR